MYQHKDYQPKIRIYSRKGLVCEYSSIQEAGRELKKIYKWGCIFLNHFGVNFRVEPKWGYMLLPPVDQYTYIIRTDLGDVVDPIEVCNHFPYKRRQWRRYYGNWKFKQPKTMQERRYSQIVLDDDVKEYNIKIRAKRNLSNLPNDWDDEIISSQGRNWKRFRKKQWKD